MTVLYNFVSLDCLRFFQNSNDMKSYDNNYDNSLILQVK